MLHLFLLGLILGWGAAIPIGPINLELTRRNLQFGTPIGIFFGLGACSADLTYLVLLCTGTLILLQHALLLKIIGILGSCILIWFGISALKLKTISITNNQVSTSYFKNLIEAYLLTLLNPFTILFWASVSSQLSIAAEGESFATLTAGLGVIVGTVSWILFLNILLHVTRHKLSETVMHRLNIVGGVILLLFATFSIIKLFFI